jgi:hypothetical protein
MQNKLKTCPFCGGEAKIHNCCELKNETAALVFYGKVGVYCTNCRIATLPFDNENMAINAWNRRCE